MIGNYMKSKLAAAFLAALSLGAGTAVSAQEAGQDQYRLATELYGHGMFERAGSIFGEIYAGTGDVTAGGYEALCSVRLQEVGNDTESTADNEDKGNNSHCRAPLVSAYKTFKKVIEKSHSAACSKQGNSLLQGFAVFAENILKTSVFDDRLGLFNAVNKICHVLSFVEALRNEKCQECSKASSCMLFVA